MDGYVLLGHNIVKQAADDYLRIRRDLWRMDASRVFATDKEREHEKALKTDLRSCVRFFRSEWYRFLCTFDGEVMLELLDKHFDDYINGKVKWLTVDKRKGERLIHEDEGSV